MSSQFEILPSVLPVFKWKGQKLYAHQIEAYQKIKNGENVLLVSPTGSGKTRAFSAFFLDYGRSFTVLYPSNALLEDQKFRFEQQTEVVIAATGDSLQTVGEKTKGGAFLKRLSTPHSTVLLTNPDVLWYLLHLKYKDSAEILSFLQSHDALIVDEFHAYRDVELTRLLFLLWTLKQLRIFRQFIFASATPDPECVNLLKRLFRIQIADGKTYARSHTPVQHTMIRHSLSVKVQPFDAHYFEKLEQSIFPIRPTTAVIFNSVAHAFGFALQIKRKYPDVSIGESHGLLPAKMRKTKDVSLVIGTSAIEAGVDFDIAHLVTEAITFSSFLQRLGRAGRRQKASVSLFVNENNFPPFLSFDGQSVTYEKMKQLAAFAFEHDGARAWFVTSPEGVQMINAIATHAPEHIRQQLQNSACSFFQAIRANFHHYADSVFPRFFPFRKNGLQTSIFIEGQKHTVDYKIALEWVAVKQNMHTHPEMTGIFEIRKKSSVLLSGPVNVLFLSQPESLPFLRDEVRWDVVPDSDGESPVFIAPKSILRFAGGLQWFALAGKNGIAGFGDNAIMMQAITRRYFHQHSLIPSPSVFLKK